MSQDDLPPQFRETKQPQPPLLEELPVEPPAAAIDVPELEPPMQAPDPYLRRS
jgi:hypothetical protein